MSAVFVRGNDDRSDAIDPAQVGKLFVPVTEAVLFVCGGSRGLRIQR